MPTFEAQARRGFCEPDTPREGTGVALAKTLLT